MKPLFNRAPLTPNGLCLLAPGAIRPQGWLRRQLELLLERPLPALPEAWTAENVRSFPALLDATIALAMALNDAPTKARAAEGVEIVLATARPDGSFGPEDDADVHARILALGALKQFFEATGEKRVLTLMDRFFRYEARDACARTLSGTASARGGDHMLLALWLYNLTGQKYLIELCRKLQEQTIDWVSHFHTFPTALPTSKSLKWQRLQEGIGDEKREKDLLEGLRRPYFQTQYHLTNGADVAAALKTPGVVNLFKSGFKEQGGFAFGWEKLLRHHGAPCGMYTCDDHLSGGNPAQGIDIKAVAALMESLEALLTLGADADQVSDALEKAAYNALPAAFSADMRLSQRLTQVNQIAATNEPRRWYNAPDDANCFAETLPPEALGAWPRFVEALWAATSDGGLYAVSLAPCTVRAKVAGTKALLTVGGGYPFSQNVTIDIQVKAPAEFPIYLRIPFWARQPAVYLPTGEIMQVRGGETACVRRIWKSGDRLRVEMPTAPRLTRWYHQSGAVEYGPLLMAWPLREHWTQDDQDRWEVRTKDDWRCALVREAPMKAVPGAQREDPFGAGDAGIEVLVKATPVAWRQDGASTGSLPMAPAPTGPEQVLTLTPYGDSALRIAQFPIAHIPNTLSRP